MRPVFIYFTVEKILQIICFVMHHQTTIRIVFKKNYPQLKLSRIEHHLEKYAVIYLRCYFW